MPVMDRNVINKKAVTIRHGNMIRFIKAKRLKFLPIPLLLSMLAAFAKKNAFVNTAAMTVTTFTTRAVMPSPLNVIIAAMTNALRIAGSHVLTMNVFALLHTVSNAVFKHD